ncbi:MAG: DUF481 domain-containing protein [Halanaerobacter sp.]
MKLKFIFVFIILALLMPNVAWGEEKLEFEFWQMEYRLNEIIKTRFDTRELRGELDLGSDLSMDLAYQFWDQSQEDNNKLENFSLTAVKDFAPSEDEKLALGVGLDYYQQTFETTSLDLSQLEKRALQLVFEGEKRIVERIDLFAEMKYGIYSDYQFFNENLASGITYDSNYDYRLKSGLSFKLGPDLKAKVGYKWSQESLERVNNEETLVNDYDLSQLSQRQQGVFLGLETRF